MKVKTRRATYHHRDGRRTRAPWAGRQRSPGPGAGHAEDRAAPPPRRVPAARDRARPHQVTRPRRRPADAPWRPRRARRTRAWRRPGVAPDRVRPADRAPPGRRRAGARRERARRGQGRRRGSLLRDPVGATPPCPQGAAAALGHRGGLPRRAPGRRADGGRGPAHRDGDAVTRPRRQRHARGGRRELRRQRPDGLRPRGSRGRVPGLRVPCRCVRHRPGCRSANDRPRGRVGWRRAGPGGARARAGAHRPRTRRHR